MSFRLHPPGSFHGIRSGSVTSQFGAQWNWRRGYSMSASKPQTHATCRGNITAAEGRCGGAVPSSRCLSSASPAPLDHCTAWVSSGISLSRTVVGFGGRGHRYLSQPIKSTRPCHSGHGDACGEHRARRSGTGGAHGPDTVDSYYAAAKAAADVGVAARYAPAFGRRAFIVPLYCRGGRGACGYLCSPYRRPPKHCVWW